MWSNGIRLYFAFLGASSVTTFLIKIPFLDTLNEYLSIPKAKRSRLSERSVPNWEIPDCAPSSLSGMTPFEFSASYSSSSRARDGELGISYVFIYQLVKADLPQSVPSLVSRIAESVPKAKHSRFKKP